MIWESLQSEGYFSFQDELSDLPNGSLERDLRLLVAAEWSVPWSLPVWELPVLVADVDVERAKHYAYCRIGEIDICLENDGELRRWDLFAYPGDMRKSYLLGIRTASFAEKFNEQVFGPMHNYYKEIEGFDSISLALRASTWLARAEVIQNRKDADPRKVLRFLLETVGPSPNSGPDFGPDMTP